MAGKNGHLQCAQFVDQSTSAGWCFPFFDVFFEDSGQELSYSLYVEIHKNKQTVFEGFVDWLTRQSVDNFNELYKLRGSFVLQQYESLLKSGKERIVVMNIHSNSSIEEDFFVE